MIARPSRPRLREALAIASNDHHPALLWTEMFRRGLIENLCDDRRKFQSHDGRWTYHPPTREACVVFAADWPNVLRAEHVARNYAFDDEHTKRIVWVEGDPFADEADRPPDEARHEWVRQLDALGYRLHKHSPDIVMIYPSPTEERKPLPRGNLAWPMSNVTSGARMSFAIEVDRETDGRWIAEVTDAPVSVIVYGPSCAEAIAKALRVLATELENPDDEDVTPVTRRTCCGLGNEDVPLSVARNMRAKQYRPMTRDRAEHLSHVVTELYRQLGGTRATAQRDVFYMLLQLPDTMDPAMRYAKELLRMYPTDNG